MRSEYEKKTKFSKNTFVYLCLCSDQINITLIYPCQRDEGDVVYNKVSVRNGMDGIQTPFHASLP